MSAVFALLTVLSMPALEPDAPAAPTNPAQAEDATPDPAPADPAEPPAPIELQEPLIAPGPLTPDPAPPPAAAPRASPAPDPTAAPSGWDGMSTGAAQVGAGTAACCVGACVTLPCALIPFAGGVLSSLVVGAIVGGTEAVVGDAVGQKRGAMLWPILASSGIFVAGGLINLAITLGAGLGSVTPINPDGTLNPAYQGILFVSLGVSLATLVAGIVVPALVYQLTGVDKEPGDEGGFGMPGFTSPADPTGTREQRAAQPAAPTPATKATPASSESEPPPPY
jgi:hypothetical protein